MEIRGLFGVVAEASRLRTLACSRLRALGYGCFGAPPSVSVPVYFTCTTSWWMGPGDAVLQVQGPEDNCIGSRRHRTRCRRTGCTRYRQALQVGSCPHPKCNGC